MQCTCQIHHNLSSFSLGLFNITYRKHLIYVGSNSRQHTGETYLVKVGWAVQYTYCVVIFAADISKNKCFDDLDNNLKQ